MSSGRRGEMSSAFSFFHGRFNIVHNFIIFMVLLGLEKLMDLEFHCPEDKLLAVGYSLVFLIVPMTMVGFVACYLSPRGVLGPQTEESGTNAPIGEGEEVRGAFRTLKLSEETDRTRNTRCRFCCENIKSHFFWMKAVMFWILIVFTHGQYAACFVKSAGELLQKHQSNVPSSALLLSWREIQEKYLIHVFQIIGLLVFLLVIIFMVTFYKLKVHSMLSVNRVKSDSERYKKLNEDILLRITEESIQEQARMKQKEFVMNLLSREDWASYDPGRPNALKELEKITAKCKAEVKRHLEVRAPPRTSKDWV